MGFITIIKIGGVVSNLISHVNELRLHRGTLTEDILGQFRMLVLSVVMGMLNDSFSNFEGKIQATKGGITQFKVFHNAKCVQVVVER